MKAAREQNGGVLRLERQASLLAGAGSYGVTATRFYQLSQSLRLLALARKDAYRSSRPQIETLSRQENH